MFSPSLYWTWPGDLSGKCNVTGQDMSRSSKCVCINFTWLLAHLSFAIRRISYVASSARIRRYMEQTWKHTAYIQVQLILVKPSRVTNDLCVFVSESCVTLCDLMDYSPPGSSVHRISQARILEWVAISYSKQMTYLLTIETNSCSCKPLRMWDCLLSSIFTAIAN